MANGKSFRRTFKGLFVRDDADQAAEADSDAAAALSGFGAGAADAGGSEATPPPAGAPRPRTTTTTGGGDSMLTAEFATIYAKTTTVGDPHTDPLLAAYAEAAAEGDEKMRAVAMRATIRALGANSESVKTTLKGRVGVLKAAVAQQTEAAEGRRKARAETLAQRETETTARIAELTAQIQALRDELARETSANQTADGGDRDAIAGFQKRVSTEINRLEELGKFLDTMEQPKKGKE